MGHYRAEIATYETDGTCQYQIGEHDSFDDAVNWIAQHAPGVTKAATKRIDSFHDATDFPYNNVNVVQVHFYRSRGRRIKLSLGYELTMIADLAEVTHSLIAHLNNLHSYTTIHQASGLAPFFPEYDPASLDVITYLAILAASNLWRVLNTPPVPIDRKLTYIVLGTCRAATVAASQITDFVPTDRIVPSTLQSADSVLLLAEQLRTLYTAFREGL